MTKLSVKAAARDAQREEAKARQKTVDSFVNFAAKMGVGADNITSANTYSFNPITRQRTLLEWIHRGSWIGGLAIDIVADDMTRAGIEFETEMPPESSEKLSQAATAMGIWSALAEGVQWGRLYGGSIVVALIDGHDMRQPLRLETIGPRSFRGLFTLDRWMVTPSLEDLVTDMGPHLGLPRYYTVQANAPALRGQTIHHSRIVMRHVGVKLPYQQALMEQLWGLSVIERLYDRLTSFDSASAGASQLVFKAYLRTLKMKGMREVVAQGGVALDGLVKYVNMMRQYQGIEGITMVDAEDEFEAQAHGAFSGLSDVLQQFGQQISGALQIPLVRLFGQSPAGLNSSGDSDLRTYYDGINQQQQRTMHEGVTLTYKMLARSRGIEIPDNFAIAFRSLWQLQDTEKVDVAKGTAEAVGSAYDSGLLSQQSAMKELRQSSRRTGIFTNITQEDIEQAETALGPPLPPEDEGFDDPMTSGPNGLPLPHAQGDMNGNQPPAGPQKQAPEMDGRPRQRVKIQQPPAGRGPDDRGDRPGLQP